MWLIQVFGYFINDSLNPDKAVTMTYEDTADHSLDLDAFTKLVRYFMPATSEDDVSALFQVFETEDAGGKIEMTPFTDRVWHMIRERDGSAATHPRAPASKLMRLNTNIEY